MRHAGTGRSNEQPEDGARPAVFLQARDARDRREFDAFGALPFLNAFRAHQNARLHEFITPNSHRVVLTLQAGKLNFVRGKLLQRLTALQFTGFRLLELIAKSATSTVQFGKLRIGARGADLARSLRRRFFLQRDDSGS